MQTSGIIYALKTKQITISLIRIHSNLKSIINVAYINMLVFYNII